MKFPTPRERPTLTVAEAAAWLGVGRQTCYEAIARGDVPSLHIGRRIVVPTAQLMSLLGMEAKGASDPPSGSGRDA